MANNSRKVLANTLIQGGGRIVILFLGLIAISLITRTLGVANYGVYTTVTIFLSFFLSISDWGIPTILARDLVQKPEGSRSLLHTVLVGRLLLAIPTVLLAVLIGWLAYPTSTDTQLGIAILSLTLIFNGIIGILVALYQSRQQMVFPTIAELTSRLVTLGLIIFAALSGRGLMFILMTALLGSIAQAALLMILARRDIDLRGAFDMGRFTRIFRDSVPMGLAVILNSLYFKIDALMLSLLKPIVDVGIYGASYKVLELVLMFPSLFGMALFPILSLHAAVHDRLRDTMQRAYDFVIILGLAIAGGGIALAPQIIDIIGGSAFVAAAEPLRVLIASVAITSINVISGLSIVAINRQKDALWINVSGLVLNIVLNLIFIPQYSYMAAAWTTLFSEVYVMAGSMYILHKYAGFRLRLGKLPALAVSVAVMMAALYHMQEMTIFLSVPIGGAIYMICVFALRGIRVYEIKELLYARQAQS